MNWTKEATLVVVVLGMLVGMNCLLILYGLDKITGLRKQIAELDTKTTIYLHTLEEIQHGNPPPDDSQYGDADDGQSCYMINVQDMRDVMSTLDDKLTKIYKAVSKHA